MSNLQSSANGLPASRFSEFIVRENQLDRCGFRGWAFVPGMLFNRSEKWWGDGGQRALPHEGVDFCLFRDGLGALLRLDAGTLIPAMYDGVVVALIDDFLGTTIVLEHRRRGAGAAFLTVYGHTDPRKTLQPGSRVTEAEIIGRIAAPGKSNASALPHLHVSVVLPLAEAFHDRLTWHNLVDPTLFTLIDPLDVITGPHFILNERGDSPEPFTGRR